MNLLFFTVDVFLVKFNVVETGYILLFFEEKIETIQFNGTRINIFSLRKGSVLK